MAGYTLKFTVTGDRGVFERVSNSLRNPRALMQNIGVLAMSRAVERLETVLKQDADAVRTGRLAASLTATVPGGGTADTIFELADDRVEVGSNVEYAAMRQFGGIIEPREKKALAIPLHPALQRQQVGPLELDPTGELLRFQPYMGGKPNVFGLLIDEEQELTGRQRKKRGQTPYGPGPLYALAYWVEQRATPFIFFDDEDRAVIETELIPEWLKIEG